MKKIVFLDHLALLTMLLVLAACETSGPSGNIAGDATELNIVGVEAVLASSDATYRAEIGEKNDWYFLFKDVPVGQYELRLEWVDAGIEIEYPSPCMVTVEADKTVLLDATTCKVLATYEGRLGLRDLK